MSSPSKATKPRRSPCSATVVAEMRDVQLPYGPTIVTIRGLTYRFFDDLRPPLRDPFRLGTFAPHSRASARPRAMPCLRLVTRLPELPLFSVPRLRSRIARSTFSPAFLPYLAMHTLHAWASACVIYADQAPSRIARPSAMSHVTLPMASRV